MKLEVHPNSALRRRNRTPRQTDAKGPDKRKSRGDRGEALVADYLLKRGYHIVERNWRRSLGEVDLIAEHPLGDRLVFVEVRARRSRRPVPPECTVTWPKQRRLIQLARLYLTTQPYCWREHVVTFDVCGVILPGGAITHIEEAFDDS